MRFYWIRNRVHQGQFQIYWSKGTTNRANYFSKHHPASHHQAICFARCVLVFPYNYYYAELV